MTQCLVITGGSKGIGEKTISLFIEKGWEIINIARTACNIPGVDNFSIDLSSAKNIEKNSKNLQAAVKGSKTVSLIHNAAFSEKDSVDSLSLDTLRRSLEISIVSAVSLTQLLIPFMPPSSSIIYISSILGKTAVPDHATYIISKHAIIGLMKATTQDLANKNIRSCCICPGLVDTDLLRATMNEEIISYMLNNKIIGNRLIEPMEIAQVIYFCVTSPVINDAIIDATLGFK